ncbi:MAG: hypothetical protein Q9227_000742 [Pyrenula ochraceoflavens]
MPPPLNVIALISGGKDSLFTLLHVLHQGHKIIALANLHPPDHGPPNPSSDPSPASSEDLDSYMYQTVGHPLIPLYSRALSLALYRHPINGTALHTGRDYSYTDAAADETEDLLPLLREIISHHPSANALCTGAILSTYQRTRVESVALRLGLTPLAYLWQYPYLPRPLSAVAASSGSLTGLLDDMAASGCEARIIKIASGGLDEDVLWGNVCEEKTRRKIVKGMARYAGLDDDDGNEGERVAGLMGAVLGEGGEYETLALDGPGYLWRERIEVEEGEREVVKGEGGTLSLKIKKARLMPKDDQETKAKAQEEKQQLRIPPLLSHQFLELQANLPPLPDPSKPPTSQIPPSPSPPLPLTPSISHHPPTKTLYISNLTPPSTSPSSPLSAQLPSLLTTLTHLLTPYSLPLSSILHTTLLLRSISHFPTLNKSYSSWPLANPLPPSRVTVSVGDLLPEGVDVSASFVVSTAPEKGGKERERGGLHVQSHSYWAPANIGPYSQAICHPLFPSGSSPELSIVYTAGQIPLIPSTMTPLSPTSDSDSDSVSNGEAYPLFTRQAVLALQHLFRVGRAMRVRAWCGGGVAYLARSYYRQSAGREEDTMRERGVGWRAKVVGECWKGVHRRQRSQEGGDEEEEEEEEEDVWDKKYNKSNMFLGKGDVVGVLEGRRGGMEDWPALTDFEVGDWEEEGEEADREEKGERRAAVPPFFAVEVDALPRDVEVEWSAVGVVSSSSSSSASHPTWKVRLGQGRKIRSHTKSAETAAEVWTSEIVITAQEDRSVMGPTFVGIAVYGPMEEKGVERSGVAGLLEEAFDGEEGREVVHVTLYAPPEGKEGSREVFNAVMAKWRAQTQVVPCYSVWSVEGKEAIAGLVVRVEGR